MENHHGPAGEAFGAAVPGDQPGLVEVGWVIAGPMPEARLKAVKRAIEAVCEELGQTFPEFLWRMPVVVRPEPETEGARRAETADLLAVANRVREQEHWDFAFAVTGRDLTAHYGDWAFAAPSRALDCAVVSLARLQPEGDDEAGLQRRFRALSLHLFGHLNNLGHRHADEDYMVDLNEAAELDRMSRYADRDKEAMAAALQRVADARVEEESRPAAPVFYLRATWENRHDLWNAIHRAKPWLFPLRFSRLTTAALSTLLVLTVTAEAWELGTTRSGLLVAVLSVAVLLGTSAFILVRQKLLPRHPARPLSEQRATAATAATVIMLWGMLTVYSLLFAASLGFGLLIMGEELIRQWAPSLESGVSFGHYLTMAATSAALGSLIGALGASFEGSDYFRHVIFIDEET